VQDETPTPTPAPASAPEPQAGHPGPAPPGPAAEPVPAPQPENWIGNVFTMLEEIKARLAELDAKLSGIGDGLASELSAIRTYLSSAEIAAYQAAPGVPTIAGTNATTVAEVPPTERVLAVGDPVKVWSDSQHRTFRLAVIKEIADDGRLLVEFDDGVVSTVWADGLEYDDRR